MPHFPFAVRHLPYRRLLLVLLAIGIACSLPIGIGGLIVEKTRINRDLVYSVVLASFVVSAAVAAAYLLLVRWPRVLFGERYVFTADSVSLWRGRRMIASQPLSSFFDLRIASPARGGAELMLSFRPNSGFPEACLARAREPAALIPFARSVADRLNIHWQGADRPVPDGPAKGVTSMVWPVVRVERAGFVLACVSVLLALACIEIAPRYVGIAPRQAVLPADAGSDLAYKWARPHDTYGWVNDTGTFSTTYEDMTFLAGGIRRSGADHRGATEDIIVVGGSITQGYEAADEDIYASRLDHMLPGQRVLNFASGGWGTYQSYLRARDALAAGTGKPVRAVVYGLYSDHRRRNIARHDWIMALTDTRGRYVIPPHVRSIWGDDLAHRDLDFVGAWPGESRSILITFLHEVYLLFRHPPRTTTHMYRVMREILVLMDEAARAHDAGLLVAFLDPPEPLLAGWLADLGIEAADCSSADWLEPRFKQGGEGYPNALQHRRWAACIAAHLRERGWADGAPAG
ncbi:MAG: hypothetical protein RIC16_17475 [Rhodospirillales bacterium]